MTKSGPRRKRSRAQTTIVARIEEEELGRKTIRKHGLRHLQCTTERKKDRNT